LNRADRRKFGSLARYSVGRMMFRNLRFAQIGSAIGSASL
jgi:hypothetical protein